MRLLKSFLACTALLSATPSLAADWYVLHFDFDSGIKLVDLDSVRESSVWTAHVEYGEVEGNGAPITYMRVEFKCDRGMMSLTESIGYDDDGEVLYSITPKELEFHSVPPGTIAERYEQIVCENGDPGTRFDGMTPFDARP